MWLLVFMFAGATAGAIVDARRMDRMRREAAESQAKWRAEQLRLAELAAERGDAAAVDKLMSAQRAPVELDE